MRWRASAFACLVTISVALLAPNAGALSSTPPGKVPRKAAPKGFPVPKLAPDAAVPPPLTWLTAAQTTGGAVIGKQGFVQQLMAGQLALKKARRARYTAGVRLNAITAHIAHLQRHIAGLESDRMHVLDIERQRAIRAYIGGGDVVDVSDFLDPKSIVDPARRAVYADAAQQEDIATVTAIETEQARERALITGLVVDQRQAQQALTAANSALRRAYFDLLTANAVLTDASHGGRVFPVDGPFNFVDSWNAFRANVLQGTTVHAHHATDIMARKGTPIVAVESGTLNRVGWNRLGGWRLWINGVSGARYYYAHMSAYAPKLHAGSHVVAGQYLGRVGNTGDAQGGPTHLHFEVHLPDPKHIDPSGDGITVNPYPLLCLLAGAPIPAIPPSEPPPKPARPKP
jgi:murein DD-endopeptidase MepM/ murein hydrolase activator NlpD